MEEKNKKVETISMEKFVEKLKNMPDIRDPLSSSLTTKKEKFIQKILEEIGYQKM